MGLKQGAIGNLHPWGTHWEPRQHIQNSLRTWRGRLWAKHMGLKQVAIGNLHVWGTNWEPRQHIGNPLRTWREHVENKGKMKKKKNLSHFIYKFTKSVTKVLGGGGKGEADEAACLPFRTRISTLSLWLDWSICRVTHQLLNSASINKLCKLIAANEHDAMNIFIIIYSTSKFLAHL